MTGLEVPVAGWPASAGPVCIAPPLTGGVVTETSGPSAPEHALRIGRKKEKSNIVHVNVARSDKMSNFLSFE